MKKLDVAVGVGLGILINLIYSFIFQGYNFLKFLITIQKTNSDVCFVDSLRGVILSLFIIVVLPPFIKYISLKIDSNYKFVLSPNLIYIVFTLVVIKTKFIIALIDDIFSYGFKDFMAMYMRISRPELLINILVTVFILFAFFILLEKQNTKIVEDFIIIMKTIILVTLLPIVNHVTFYVFKLKSDYNTNGNLLKSLLETQNINIYLTLILLIVIMVSRKLYRDEMDRSDFPNHAVLLGVFFAITPELIKYMYRLLIAVVDFVRLRMEVDHAFKLMYDDYRYAVIYSIPTIALALLSFYVIHKNYFPKDDFKDEYE